LISGREPELPYLLVISVTVSKNLVDLEPFTADATNDSPESARAEAPIAVFPDNESGMVFPDTVIFRQRLREPVASFHFQVFYGIDAVARKPRC
jgi:hypothetical protein